MTCIVGLEHDGDVWIGGDSAGVGPGYGLTVRADVKVFTRDRGPDRWAFGFCGSFRVGQLIRYSLELPVPDDDDDLYEFMVTDFVDALRSALDIGGALFRKGGVEWGETFLVGLRGVLFCVEEDFQVGRAVDPYVSVGCGDDPARGAMHALSTVTDLDPDARILTALAAAERHSAGVRSPFLVVSTKRDVAPVTKPNGKKRVTIKTETRKAGR